MSAGPGRALQGELALGKITNYPSAVNYSVSASMLPCVKVLDNYSVAASMLRYVKGISHFFHEVIMLLVYKVKWRGDDASCFYSINWNHIYVNS